MAVISCTRKDKISGQDEDKKTGYKEEFKVIVESGDEPATILNSPLESIPKKGDPHPVDPLATVKSRSVKETASRTVWTLMVAYEFAFDEAEDNGGGGGGSTSGTVLQIYGGNWYEDYIAEQDSQGKRYQNSAGDPRQKTNTRPHPTFTVVSTSRDFLVPRYIFEVGQVNNFSYSMLGITFKKKTLKFDSFDFSSNGDGTWTYTYVFKAKLVARPVISEEVREVGAQRSAGWTDYQLDAGYRELNDQKALVPIIPKDQDSKKTSSPVSSPWPLDGEGKALRREDFKDSLNWIPFEEFPETGFRIFRWDWSKLLSPEASQGLNT